MKKVKQGSYWGCFIYTDKEMHDAQLSTFKQCSYLIQRIKVLTSINFFNFTRYKKICNIA